MSCVDGRLFSTHFTCNLHDKDIHIEWQTAPLSLPDELHDDILNFWNSLTKDYIFNGRLARLDTWSLAANQCYFNMRPTDYRTLLHSNANVDVIRRTWGGHYLSRALGISAVLLSGDDKIVFMKRSANVGEYPECYDVFGGHIDVPKNGDRPNVFSAMAQELHEEVGLAPYDYNLKLIGLIESTPNAKPELVFLARTELFSQQILSRTKDALDHIEFTRVHTIDNNKTRIEQFLSDNVDDISPSAYGSFCVYMSVFLTSEE